MVQVQAIDALFGSTDSWIGYWYASVGLGGGQFCHEVGQEIQCRGCSDLPSTVRASRHGEVWAETATVQALVYADLPLAAVGDQMPTDTNALSGPGLGPGSPRLAGLRRALFVTSHPQTASTTCLHGRLGAKFVLQIAQCASVAEHGVATQVWYGSYQTNY